MNNTTILINTSKAAILAALCFSSAIAATITVDCDAGNTITAAVASAKPGDRYQFERLGYFCADPDSTSEKLVFNRTVQLRDTWAKIEKRETGKITR